VEVKNKEVEELGKTLNAFVDSEKEVIQTFNLIKNGYVTLEKVDGGQIHLRFTDKAVKKNTDKEKRNNKLIDERLKKRKKLFKK